MSRKVVKILKGNTEFVEVPNVVLEDHIFRISDKRICRRMSGVKRETNRGWGWSKFHKEEPQIYDLYHVFLEQ